MLKQVSVFVANSVGTLAKATSVLKRAEVNMRALSIADTADFGIIRAIVDKPEDAAAMLREAGFLVDITDVLGIKIPDRPGGLHDILAVLADAGVAVEYAYAFGGDAAGEACLILKVDDLQRAMPVLRDSGVDKVEF